MPTKKPLDNDTSQVDKFREAARELETDQSEEAFDRIVKRVAKKPAKREEKKGKDESGD